LEHPVFGYTRVPDGLVAAFQGWLERNYQWQVPEEWLVWIPGVVTGLNLAAMATAQPDGGVLIPTPVYYPFRSVPANAGQRAIEVPMERDGDRWVMDIDALDAATDADTRILMIANPQNPTGRVYDQAELQELAAFAARRDLVICSDEIHCPILLDQQAVHWPIASLDPEIAARSISLYAATKAYNVPGLSCAVAVIPDADLRRRFNKARRGLTPLIGPLAYTASEAVFNDQSGWLDRLLAYLRGNHERVLAVAGQRMTPVEGTYLAWADVRDLGLADPDAHFERFGLGLSDGAAFGGPGFVRFNFGCPRSLLEEGLTRFSAAIDAARLG
ncbi:MAG: aminotransferase class I/II-fold pyridoxal phosphate-dependent enzyme, partial [Gammaproteobacteria bacterium]|nr:aminotransferase class I/II-fold pyridoxal phosphate-dependent enzyme [Gammaproteobacteria bacterium]